MTSTPQIIAPAWKDAIERSTDLAQLESIIAKGKQTFVEVGLAILRIRDAKLYKSTHSSWESYCVQRWGWGRNYANKLARSASTAAELAEQGTAVPTERHARELAAVDPDKRADVISIANAGAEGEPTADDIRDAAKALEQADGERERAISLFTSSASNEHYTPSEFIEAARQCMGGIDLDPASCAEANEVVGASRYFSIDDDGLSRSWQGRVWLNPPYGKIEIDGKMRPQAAHWLKRLDQQYRSGGVAQACALVNASTGDRWFHMLWERPLCFPPRIRFWLPGGESQGRGLHGSVIAYWGTDVRGFVDAFDQFGQIVLPDMVPGASVAL